MSEMVSTHMFRDESYSCNRCSIDIDESEVDTDTWRCVHCDERLVINSEKLTREIMRKKPEEVTTKDLVLLDVGDFHEVFKAEHKKGSYFFNLKGYGKYKHDTYEWVNCEYSSYT